MSKLDQFHDGEWIEPVGKGFVVECCKCGLRHRMDFRVVRGRVQFRAWRVGRGKKLLDAGGEGNYLGTHDAKQISGDRAGEVV